MIEVDDGEQGLPELAQVQLQHPRHRINIRRVCRIGQRILALLKRLPKVRYLDLRSRHAEYSLVMQSWKGKLIVKIYLGNGEVFQSQNCLISLTKKIDDPDTAPDNQRNLILGRLHVLL